jgi:type II secretory pathway pseudopilin PulG
MKQEASADKNREQSSSAGGFSVTEMLVVFAVVGLLVALLVATCPQLKMSSNRTKAAWDICRLYDASTAYRNEYHRWPNPKNATELVLILGGLKDPMTRKEAGPKDQNPKHICFMDFKAHQVSFAGAGLCAFLDPWGVPYAYAFDNGIGGEYFEKQGWPQTGRPWRDDVAGDNVLPRPFPPGQINAGCAFFSVGPDWRTGMGPSDPSKPPKWWSIWRSKLAYEDDVASWTVIEYRQKHYGR